VEEKLKESLGLQKIFTNGVQEKPLGFDGVERHGGTQESRETIRQERGEGVVRSGGHPGRGLERVEEKRDGTWTQGKREKRISMRKGIKGTIERFGPSGKKGVGAQPLRNEERTQKNTPKKRKGGSKGRAVTPAPRE